MPKKPYDEIDDDEILNLELDLGDNFRDTTAVTKKIKSDLTFLKEYIALMNEFNSITDKNNTRKQEIKTMLDDSRSEKAKILMREYSKDLGRTFGGYSEFAVFMERLITDGSKIDGVNIDWDIRIQNRIESKDTIDEPTKKQSELPNSESTVQKAEVTPSHKPAEPSSKKMQHETPQKEESKTTKSDLPLKERFDAYTTLKKYSYLTLKHPEVLYSKEDEKDFSMSLDELNNKVKELENQKLNRIALNKKRAELRDKKKKLENEINLLNQSIKNPQIDDSEKNACILQLSTKTQELAIIQAQLSKLGHELKELPSIAKIDSALIRYRKIHKWKLQEGKYKAKGKDKIDVPVDQQVSHDTPQDKPSNGSQERLLDEQQTPQGDSQEEKTSEPQTPRGNQQIDTPTTKGDEQSLDEQITNMYGAPPTVSRRDSNISIINAIPLADKNGRNADGERFTYIVLHTDLDGFITSSQQVTESLTEFTKHPLHTYKKAVKDKFDLIDYTKLLGYKDSKNIRKRLIKEFKELIAKGEYDLCIERYIALKTALMPEEIKVVVETGKYPETIKNNYKVNKASIPINANQSKSLIKHYNRAIQFDLNCASVTYDNLHPTRNENERKQRRMERLHHRHHPYRKHS